MPCLHCAPPRTCTKLSKSREGLTKSYPPRQTECTLSSYLPRRNTSMPPHPSGEQPPQVLVVSAIEVFLEERSTAATEPSEVGAQFPRFVGLCVTLPLVFKLSCFISLAPADCALDVVLSLTGTRDLDRWGRGLPAGVVHLIALKLGYVPSAADAQVFRVIELKAFSPHFCSSWCGPVNCSCKALLSLAPF